MKTLIQQSFIDMTDPENLRDIQLEGNPLVIPVGVRRIGGAAQFYRYSAEYIFVSQVPTGSGRFNGMVHKIMWTTPIVPYQIEYVVVELTTNLTFTGGTVDNDDSLQINAGIDSGSDVSGIYQMVDAVHVGLVSNAYNISAQGNMWAASNSLHRGPYADDGILSGYVSGGGKFATDSATYMNKNFEIMFSSPDYTIATMSGTARLHIGLTLLNFP